MKNQTTPEQKNCATPSTPETQFSEHRRQTPFVHSIESIY